MWNLSLNKKDFIDLWIGGNRKILAFATEQLDSIEPDKDLINLHWDTRPSAEYYFPHRIIASDENLKHIFTALNSTPAAATPVSAYTRVLTLREYRTYKLQLKSISPELAPFVAMAMAEAALLAEDRSNWKEIGLAECTKTLSYTWGKAIKFGDANTISHELPTRWFQTYLATTNLAPSETLRRTVTAVSGILSNYIKITERLIPSEGYPGALAVALYKNDRKTLNELWFELTLRHGFDITLDNLMMATREERAAYLQFALKHPLSPEDNGSTTALCAFLATQVAPGSLEHLNLLRSAKNPEIVFWYAMYAALISPDEILGIQGGIGYRIYKLMATTPPTHETSTADICYSELKVLQRSGMDAFLKKTISSRELQVELIPFVSASFDYSSAQQLDLLQERERGRLDIVEYEYHQASRLNHEYKARVEQAISLLSEIINDTPEDYTAPYSTRRVNNRKKPIE